ncbi:MAG: GFA family protein, partial [Actinomycetota bacterium]|nr:GFA family protein [Actinomycetota bacterium]
MRGELREVINCHCEPCRRFTGHFMAGTAAATNDLIMESDGTLAWWWRTPTVRYGFCSACGSSL